MARYAIGDIQGLYDPLCRLLDKIHFDDSIDQLWFVGDLVNRGPDSLQVIRLLQSLSSPPIITLGNHDIHLIASIFNPKHPPHPKDTLQSLLDRPDIEDIGHWLRQQPLLHHDQEEQVMMAHAGIYPLWTLEEAKNYAKEFEHALQSSDFILLLSHLYGDTPNFWTPNLHSYDRLRFICNAFTRMRYCTPSGALSFHYKGPISNRPDSDIPWFQFPARVSFKETLIFGHWASLQGRCDTPNFHAIDTGCIWGGPLTALRIEDKQRFSVSS